MVFKRNCSIIAGLFLFLLILFSASLNLTANVNGAISITKLSQQNVTHLQLGDAIRRRVKSSERHFYQIKLEKNQYIKIVLEQYGIDLALSVPNTDIRFDRENGGSGIEELFFIAEESRDYLVCVFTEASSANGEYVIKIETIKTLTEQDTERDKINNYKLGTKYYRDAENEKDVVTKQNSFSAALDYYKKAENSYWQSVVLNKLGIVYLTSDSPNLEEAEKYFEKSKELKHSIGDVWGEAQVLSNLAITLSRSGKKQAAKEALEAAIPLHQQVNNRIGEAQALNSLGLIYQNMGKFDNAIEIFDNILNIPYEDNPDFLDAQAGAVESKARLLSRLGKHKEALDLHLANIPRRQIIGNKTNEAITYHNSGLEYLHLRDFDLAIKSFNRAKDLTKNIRLQAYSYDHLGVCYWFKENYKDALEHNDKALDIFSNKITDPVGKASALYHRGLIYFSMKDYQQALTKYKETLALEENTGSKNDTPATLYGIALAYQQLGDLEQAKNNIQRAINMVEFQLLTISPQDYRLSFFSKAEDYYKLYSELLMSAHNQDKSKRLDIEAFKMSELGRARNLLDLLIEKNINFHQDIDDALLEKERQLAKDLTEKLNKIQKKGTQEESKLEDDIKALKIKYSEIEKDIRKKNPEYTDLRYPEPLSLPNIQESILDEDTIILEYSLGEKHSYLWVIKKINSKVSKIEESITSYELPKRSVIEELAQQLYCDLTIETRRKKDEPDSIFEKRKNNKNYLKSSTKLGEMLLGHVAEQLGDKRLVIIPDGILQYIPFAALNIPSGGSQTENFAPLVDKHEIVYMPSVSAAGILRTDTKYTNRTPAPNLLAIFANPIFENNRSNNVPTRNTQTATAVLKSDPLSEYKPFGCPDKDELVSLYNGLQSLVGTEKELNTILSIASKKGKCLPKQQAEVSRDTVMDKALLSQYKIIHFATHAIINDERPDLSAIALSAFDEKGRKTEQFLRLSDIYKLNLPAELVILSACQTGIGPSIKGEGIVSFSRGFMHAGTKRIITSLWQLRDDSTPVFMEKFYKALLQDSLTPSKALQKAQKEMIKDYHPFKWAPFIIQGDWTGIIK